METMKAVAIRQPEITRLARGEVTVEVKTWRTDYRGELLLVSALTPRIEPAGYAIAVGRLVDCRPMTRADEKAAGKVSYPQAQAWVFEKVRALKIFPVKVGWNVFDVTVPPFGLQMTKAPIAPANARLAHKAEPDPPSEPETSWLAPAALPLLPATAMTLKASPDDDVVVTALRAARSALAEATGGLASIHGRVRTAAARETIARAAASTLEELSVCIHAFVGQLSEGAAARETGRSGRRGPHLALSPSLLSSVDHGLDVLVVEGHELAARAVTRLLAPVHRVRIAASLPRALDEIARRLPHVVVSDHDVPGDAGGQLFSILAAQHPEVRRILLASRGPEVWTRRLDERLVDRALVKPADRQTLLDAVAA
jgi:CheY-like chemotaxis protein